jgi:hypothetical protein
VIRRYRIEGGHSVVSRPHVDGRQAVAVALSTDQTLLKYFRQKMAFLIQTTAKLRKNWFLRKSPNFPRKSTKSLKLVSITLTHRANMYYDF